MPSHLKALLVILLLATIVFAFAKKPACISALTTQDFERRRNLWFFITLTAFLAHNFWVYIVVTGALILVSMPKEKNKVALFFFILFAVPTIQSEISGLGIIQHFFTIHYVRLLALLVLLPSFLWLRKQTDTLPFGSTLSDKLVAGYLILQFGLMLTVNTFTGTLRSGLFYSFIDVFLPYYVASRSLKRTEDFREALMAFALAALVLSAIGLFEMTRRWLLYSALENALGVNWGYGGYLMRGEEGLRAQATTGQPIPLGFVLAVALGLYLGLRKAIPSTGLWNLGLLGLLAGLISPLSRGPWIGAAVMIIVFTLASPSPAKRLIQLLLFGGIIFAGLLASPVGNKVIDLLPFVGTVDEVTVSYRTRLLEIGIYLVMQNPFFGAYSYFMAPEMQEMKQGNGMIDLVNTYLAVGLGSGLVGLTLFCGFFFSVASSVFRAMRKLDDRQSETYALGQSLVATILGIMVIIFTVSSITIIPTVYWSIAGIGVAYSSMLTKPDPQQKNKNKVQ